MAGIQRKLTYSEVTVGSLFSGLVLFIVGCRTCLVGRLQLWGQKCNGGQLLTSNWPSSSAGKSQSHNLAPARTRKKTITIKKKQKDRTVKVMKS